MELNGLQGSQPDLEPVNSALRWVNETPAPDFRKQVETWFNHADGLLRAHREDFLLGDPGRPALEWHYVAFKRAIQQARVLRALIEEEGLPANGTRKYQDVLRKLEFISQRLQDSFDAFHNPETSDDGAVRIIHEAFPA